MHRAIANFEDPSGQLVDEVTIVRHEHHCAGEFLQRFQQHVFGAHIQVICRLVEQHEVAGHHEHPRQGIPVALAARKHADGFENVIRGK